MKWLKRVSIALVILFLAAQVIRPSMTNPPVDESRTLQAKAQVSPEVYAILERSCNDCHSNKTTWPWYSQVTPISWYLVRHVNQGRRELNVSDWAKYDARRATRKLDEICEQVNRDEMPLKSYLVLHPSANLSDADKKAICDWTNQERARLAAQQTNNQ
ncbi:MAG: heme-binding domain-containing protein [Pyrinomonadaceae bacterium]|nr:heme-binding domain-containing protein [Pyrinomonadaceae bacterium]